MFVVLIGDVGGRRLHHIDEAVALAVGEIEAAGQLVLDDRTGDGQRPAVAAVVLHRPLGLEAIGERRPRRGDLDHAGDGVLAEQRALRTFQDFDVREFAQVVEADAVAGAVDAVDVEADRFFQAGVVRHVADAADARDGRRLVAVGGDVEAGGQQGQVADRFDLGVLELLLVEDGDHDRHVLQPLALLLGGDDNLRHGIPGRLGEARTGGVLRQRRRGGGERAGGDAAEQKALGI